MVVGVGGGWGLGGVMVVTMEVCCWCAGDGGVMMG